MKNIILFIAAGILIIGNAIGQSQNNDLENLRNAYITAVKNSDTQGILKVYSDDAVIHNTNGEMSEGTSEIRDQYDEFFGNTKATISFENVSEDELAKDIFFYHDKVFLEMDSEDETIYIEVVNIAEKVNGEWRVTKSYRWPMPGN